MIALLLCLGLPLTSANLHHRKPDHTVQNMIGGLEGDFKRFRPSAPGQPPLWQCTLQPDGTFSVDWEEDILCPMDDNSDDIQRIATRLEDSRMESSPYRQRFKSDVFCTDGDCQHGPVWHADLEINPSVATANTPRHQILQMLDTPPYKNYPDRLEGLMHAINDYGRKAGWIWMQQNVSPIIRTTPLLLDGSKNFGCCFDFAGVMVELATSPPPNGLGIQGGTMGIHKEKTEGEHGKGLLTVALTHAIDKEFVGNVIIKKTLVQPTPIAGMQHVRSHTYPVATHNGVPTAAIPRIPAGSSLPSHLVGPNGAFAGHSLQRMVPKGVKGHRSSHTKFASNSTKPHQHKSHPSMVGHSLELEETNAWSVEEEADGVQAVAMEEAERLEHDPLEDLGYELESLGKDWFRLNGYAQFSNHVYVRDGKKQRIYDPSIGFSFSNPSELASIHLEKPSTYYKRKDGQGNGYNPAVGRDHTGKRWRSWAVQDPINTESVKVDGKPLDITMAYDHAKYRYQLKRNIYWIWKLEEMP